jgi:hypothetical protein
MNIEYVSSFSLSLSLSIFDRRAGELFNLIDGFAVEMADDTPGDVPIYLTLAQ